jgi:hypothetical protein
MSMRTLTLLAFAFLLGGCFRSERPLFDPARGACPFATPASYQETDRSSSTERLVFETDGAYCKITNSTGTVSRRLFVPMGRDWWIVQDKEQRPTYGLMHLAGTRLTQFTPSCSDFSPMRLRSLGVAFNKERTVCTADSAQQIETLFRSWRSPFRQASSAYQRISDGQGQTN